METYIVKQEDQGKRLDTYISNQNNDLTRTAVQRLNKKRYWLMEKNEK